MTAAAPKPDDTANGKMFDDPDRLVALAQASFAKAKDKAIAENDRHGVPSYGAVRGKLAVRNPVQAKPKTFTGPA